MKRPSFKNLPVEVIRYIEELEATVNGSSDLIKELNLVSDTIAKEIGAVRLKGNVMSDDKSFDKIITLIEKSAKVRALSTPAKKEDKPDEEKAETETEETKPTMRNISDLAKKRNAG